MDAARKRADEGYVEDVARVVAAVVRRRPVVSAIVLGCGIGIALTDWFRLDPTLLVSLLVLAVATSEASAAIVLLAGPLASYVVLAGFFGVSSDGPGLSDPLPSLVAGLAAALLALAARRVRSMTALPAEHPSFELSVARTGSLVPAPNP